MKAIFGVFHGLFFEERLEDEANAYHVERDQSEGRLDDGKPMLLEHGGHDGILIGFEDVFAFGV